MAHPLSYHRNKVPLDSLYAHAKSAAGICERASKYTTMPYPAKLDLREASYHFNRAEEILRALVVEAAK